MPRELLRDLIWLIPVCSLLLTWYGLSRPSWKAVSVAASLSFIFGVITIFSIGIVLFALCILQLIAVVIMRRQIRSQGGI